MVFRKFTEYGAASRNTVTLRVSQVIFISNGTVSKYESRGCEGVNLYVDDQDTRLGIEFVDKYDENIKECRKISKEKSGVAINISHILRYFDIPKPNKKVELEISKEDKLMVLNLAAVKS